MPPLTLQPDHENDRTWVMLGEHRLVSLRAGDREGLKVITTWLVDGQAIGVEEAAVVQGVTPRTVAAYQAIYATTGNSADLLDRRHFNPGQQTAYRMEPHKPELIRCATLNLLRGEPTSERRLAKQVGSGMDDRTVGRHLHAIGWRAAEEAGLAEEVAAYLAAERQRAYWAGVAGQPLESVELRSINPREWQKPRPGVVGVSLGVAHLTLNGSYASLKRLLGASVAEAGQALRTGHTLLVYLMRSGGARLSQAKHFVWQEVGGLLCGCARASASGLRHWLVTTAQRAQAKVTVRRSDGREETITCLQDYQEEAVAQRVKRGAVQGRAVYIDDYVNTVYRQEPIAQAKHGTWNRVVKAFRRHMVQDADTGHAVTCPLGPSDVTPLSVLQQVVPIIEGGLDRAGSEQSLELVMVDRWWSAKSVICWVLDKASLTLLTWGKGVKTIQEALAEVREEELKQHPVMAQVLDEATGQRVERVVSYRLDTALKIYDLETPVRGVVDWDGVTGSQKRVRLVVGVQAGTDALGTSVVVDRLRFRQWVEILLKQLQRRVNWPAFGGGEAHERPAAVDTLDAEARQQVTKNRQQVATRQANDQARLQEVERELEQLRQGEAPTNGLRLGICDLKKIVQELRRRIGRATARLEELDTWLQCTDQQVPLPPAEPVAELDLTREAILTQLKLDVFTAQETLVSDFIEQALKPVLRAEAEKQATARQEWDARSTAKGREGQPLNTDVEDLYRIKVANLERETILSRLLNQPGEFVQHKTQRIILSVAARFEDRRIQAAYERYCAILNLRDIRVQQDGGEPWRLLFTYHLDAPSSSARFK